MMEMGDNKGMKQKCTLKNSEGGGAMKMEEMGE